MTPDEMHRVAEYLTEQARMYRAAGAPVAATERSILAAKLRAMAAASAPSGWQPIETAPISCRGEYPRYVLVYNGHHVGVGYCYPDEYTDRRTVYVDESDEMITPLPTH